MTTTDCSGEWSDRPVKFGRKGREWLARKILNACAPTLDGWGTQEAVSLLIAWYLERPELYVTWRDDSEWRGRGFSNGCWMFNPLAVGRDFDKAEHAVDRGLDALHHPTLEDWLRADIEDRLNYAGAQGGVSRIPVDARAFARHRCQCGVTFLPDRRDARNCDNCRAAKREKRRSRKV